MDFNLEPSRHLTPQEVREDIAAARIDEASFADTCVDAVVAGRADVALILAHNALEAREKVSVLREELRNMLGADSVE